MLTAANPSRCICFGRNTIKSTPSTNIYRLLRSQFPSNRFARGHNGRANELQPDWMQSKMFVPITHLQDIEQQNAIRVKLHFVSCTGVTFQHVLHDDQYDVR